MIRTCDFDGCLQPADLGWQISAPVLRCDLRVCPSHRGLLERADADGFEPVIERHPARALPESPRQLIPREERLVIRLRPKGTR